MVHSSISADNRKHTTLPRDDLVFRESILLFVDLHANVLNIIQFVLKKINIRIYYHAALNLQWHSVRFEVNNIMFSVTPNIIMAE
jgi:hypothetical protein